MAPGTAGFVTANARRLQQIAALVVVGGLLSQALESFGRGAVLDALQPAGDAVIASFELSLLPVLAGLGISVAAEVFRQGAVLREDVEGLV